MKFKSELAKIIVEDIVTGWSGDKRIDCCNFILKVISIMWIIFVVMAIMMGLANIAFSKSIQTPQQYFESIAKQHGELVINSEGSKAWGVKLSHETVKIIIRPFEDDIKLTRFVGYLIVYGELTEEAAKRDNYSSRKYLLIERNEIASWDDSKQKMVESYLDFGPDFDIDIA
ncbi:hypothetical protein LCGC14_2798600, partial [marine sediment metagenome]